ncbi:MAG TPA: lipopolysaccharide heptosyltransferase II [Candidatus Acidoferrales bacterium]|nr:lipopolysaccharide heptosyltransferase II [Candidatus Acidoferrales bacterium]
MRATNWLGDAVMSLPAIRAIRGVFPHAHLAVAARPWVADLYGRERAIDRVIVYPARQGWNARREFAARLRGERFDAAILLQNAFDAALIVWMAGIPERIGYSRDGRRLLLTRAVPVPEPGEIPRHERFYYLELLRRAGMIERLPASEEIRLDGATQACEAGLKRFEQLGVKDPVAGISPGAAYGNAKRWPAARFAEAAAKLGMPVLIFGSSAERPLCGEVAAALGRAGPQAWNLAGETSLREFIDLAAACRVFLTNDSGAMHIASALGVPTVTVFGATDDTTTGPTGPLARVVREHAECSPCLLRECPIDHRCMTRVTSERVAAEALALIEETAWIREPKS